MNGAVAGFVGQLDGLLHGVEQRDLALDFDALTVLVECARLEPEQAASRGVALAVVFFRADLVEVDAAELLLGLGFQAVELLLGLGAGGVDLMARRRRARGCVGSRAA